MLKTSLGYHTFSMLALVGSRKELSEILKDFQHYSKDKELIKIHGSGKKLKYFKKDGSVDETFTNYKIFFKDEQRFGVSWTLKFCNYSPSYKFMFIVEARVNPKILTGTDDYITASGESDYHNLAACYNNLVRSISPLIPLFSSYTVNRVDYCINSDVKEMGYICEAWQLLELLRRGDIPSHLKRLQEYSEKGRRLIDCINGFTLECASYTVRCYYKYFQLLKEDPNNPSLEDAINVIRFEVQYNYLKVYNLRKAIKDAEECTKLILSDRMSEEAVTEYFSKTIMLGDYYSLKKARRIITSKGFCPSKEKRLLDTLNLVSTHKGIHKAREHFGDLFTKAIFDRSLKELVTMDINPVTIPREWGYDYLPNLLKVYRGLKS